MAPIDELERALHLHLFLHARSLLSSAVRLNLIGPYLSSQLLLHPMREIINAQVAPAYDASAENDEDPWSWTMPPEVGPATTWPLGELLTGRHDLQHTRIFNS
jgi:urease accessory protein